MYEPQIGGRDNYVLSPTTNYGVSASKSITLLLVFIFLHLFATLAAQSPGWEYLDDFSWNIESPSGYFDSGDTIEYTLRLGAAGDPAIDVLAIDLQLELEDHVTIPTNCSPNTAGSWLHDDSYYAERVQFDANARELAILTERTNFSSRNGSGLVYSFRLISGADNVLAADLITDGGGMVLVDNVEMRMAAPTPPKVVKLEHATLDQTGNPRGWESLALPDSGDGGLHLSSGLHLLKETLSDGKVRVRKVLVR
jgi:hypothetical protein